MYGALGWEERRESPNGRRTYVHDMQNKILASGNWTLDLSSQIRRKPSGNWIDDLAINTLMMDQPSYPRPVRKGIWPVLQPSAFPMPTKKKEWQRTINKLNLWNEPQGSTMFNTAQIKIAVNQAVAYAGTTWYFVLSGAPVTDTKPTNDPLTIHMPDGDHLNRNPGNVAYMWHFSN